MPPLKPSFILSDGSPKKQALQAKAFCTFKKIVIPAKAGIQIIEAVGLDSRLAPPWAGPSGNDGGRINI